MKRKIAGLLAALMVLSVGTTVMAAGSNEEKVTASVSVKDVADAKDVSAITTTTTGVKEIKVAKSEQAVDVADLAKVAKTEEKNVRMVAVLDVKVEWTGDKGASVTLTFTVDGVASGDNIAVLHYNETKKAWENIKVDSVGDKSVTATFTSLSPVAIVKLPAGAKIAADAQVAPATGSTAPVVAVLAMICLAGVVVCGKKVKFNA